ncbi:hypothetical protein KM043_016058 [Ampulex compressa]|nr:hypothetical protein KM043_016058 [Ampulex compressa]
MKYLIVPVLLIGACLGDVSHILGVDSTTTTPPPPPKPYHFQYQAGRYPAHVDRIHEEEGDGSGRIYGSYSFIDPKHKLRTVEYTADADGFHPTLINFEDTLSQPVDSEAVQLAKEKHYQLYHKIAESHAHGVPVNVPRESLSVSRAKDRHLELYNKIAEEHAAIAAQREAERPVYEANSGHNNADKYD